MKRPSSAFVSHRTRMGRVVATAVVLSATFGVSSSLILAADEPTIMQAPAHEPLQSAQRTSPPSTAPPTTVPPPAPQPVIVPARQSLDPMVQQIFDMTNAERIAVGAVPLTYHHQLAEAAAIHAADQRNRPCEIGYLTHTGTDGSRAGDRIARTGLSVSNWGENIACGFSGVAAVMAGWMNSPGHRANMLNPSLTHIGISVMTSDSGRYYWVQTLGVPR